MKRTRRLFGHGKVLWIQTALFLVSTAATAAPPDDGDILQGAATPWNNPQDFPLPYNKSPDLCRAPVSLRACDPDAVFADSDWQQLDAFLADTNPTLKAPCNRLDDNSVPVQIAVAVTRKVRDGKTERKKFHDCDSSHHSFPFHV